MDLGAMLAINIKELSAARQLSLGDVSKLSGLSTAMLSDMENGKSNPTINTLWKLANAFNVPYTRLLEENEVTGAIVRGSEVAKQVEEHEHYRAYIYFNIKPGRDFELIKGELDAKQSHCTLGHAPHSEEFIYVLNGTLELRTQGKSFELQAGDGLEFDSSKEHTYVNVGDDTVAFICVNYYPQRS